MNSFKTQEEIFKYLIDGGKIKHKLWGKEEYAQLRDGFNVNETGLNISLSYSYSKEWTPYEEPKPEKTYKMYRHWFLTDNNLHYADYNEDLDLEKDENIYCTCCNDSYDVKKVLETEIIKEITI